MKYTRIPQDELLKLEDEFVNFLVVNGIAAKDWIAIKENEPVNAEEIIKQFSDVVWESILRNTKYVTKVEEESAYYFKCDADEIHLIRVLKIGKKGEQQIATKKYTKLRELELFEMIQNGCKISEGEDYEMLKST